MDRRELLEAVCLAAPLSFVGRWADGTETDAGMIVHGRLPHNAEPHLSELVKSWITPNDLFYVRSHAPVPKIDVDSFRLSVEGMVEKPFEVTLSQLQSEFKQYEAIATMTCAGNRRTEHSLVKPVGGVPWQAGAIGNASWRGARLSDLLDKAGVKDGAKYVWFEGVDEIKRSSGIIPFGASIPLAKAMSDSGGMPGALVAYGMNGETLPEDHGFPMRTIVPGYIGARSVKWLGKIIVSDRPSTNHYVATAYKLVTEGTPDEWAAKAPIENFVINSVTCLPSSQANVKAGKINVQGYAIANGLPGRTISRVELSADQGQTWVRASFTGKPHPFCWRLWNADVSVGKPTKHLIVRATDSDGSVQPKSVAWNMKGYLFNGWHSTPIQPR